MTTKRKVQTGRTEGRRRPKEERAVKGTLEVFCAREKVRLIVASGNLPRVLHKALVKPLKNTRGSMPLHISLAWRSGEPLEMDMKDPFVCRPQGPEDLDKLYIVPEASVQHALWQRLTAWLKAVKTATPAPTA